MALAAARIIAGAALDRTPQAPLRAALDPFLVVEEIVPQRLDLPGPDQPSGEVPQRWDDPVSPAGEVGDCRLGLETAQGELSAVADALARAFLRGFGKGNGLAVTATDEQPVR